MTETDEFSNIKYGKYFNSIKINISKGETMIGLIILGIIIIIGIIRAVYVKIKEDDDSLCGWILIVIGGVAFLLFLLILSIAPLEYKANIKQYEIFKQSLQISREKGIDIENAAILIKITTWNEWIVSIQYWNTIYFCKDFIPDEVMELEIMK